MLGIFLAVASPAQPAYAAGTVTDCSTYGPGAGTLQAALTGGGIVTFDCDGTIVVPQIFIGAATVLDATGHDVTLSGNNANQVLFVNGSLTMHHLTVADGNNAGGAGAGALITSGSSMTVEDSTFSGNTSTGPGGGIFNDGTLTVTHSLIANNRADGGEASYGQGGGIRNDGVMTLTLNRPEARNAMSRAMNTALAEMLAPPSER